MDLFELHAVVFWDFVTCVIPEVVALPIYVHVDGKLYQPGSAPVYLSQFICFLSDTYSGSYRQSFLGRPLFTV